ncbi:hypothetical protein SPSIL_052470 [Sporomusa silvacetica DSM 10669]|uniref:Piwi domain-containing protein n=1 Tax=Sporomusa silvacetica DSM 10669 TaxID=1123289 RepID=A0ABZ3ITM3_9FIRM|nr:hypothetical protein [Sporomusa silvacetica]OZC19662.1 hypothetical protein SPSIL_20920 [Sporomusa silvacetica DSM 10669]
MASLVEEKVVLDKSDIDILNSFVGFGNLKETDVLFFGVEEGLGPNQPNSSLVKKNYAEVELRCKYFGEDTNLYLNEKNKHEGFWVNPNDTNKLRESCYLNLGYEYSPPGNPGGIYVKYTARMIQAFNAKSDKDAARWFDDTIEVENKLRTFMREGVYGNRFGKRAALADWRPLPRQKIGTWLYQAPFEEKTYLNTFDFIDVEDKYCIQLRENRVNIFKRLFNQYHIPIIIAIGERRRFVNRFSNMFKDKLDFYEVGLPEKTTINYAFAKVLSGTTLVVCIDHFNSIPNNQTGWGGMSLDKLKSITLAIRKLLAGNRALTDKDIYNKYCSRNDNQLDYSDKKRFDVDYTTKNSNGDVLRGQLAEFIKNKLENYLTYVNGKMTRQRYISNKMSIRDAQGGKGLVKNGNLLVFEVENKQECCIRLLVVGGELENRKIIFSRLATAGEPFKNITNKATGTCTIYTCKLYKKNEVIDVDFNSLKEIVKGRLDNFLKYDLPEIEQKLEF